MAIEGWYYLHTNGDLIYKREMGGTAADIRESDFARAPWPVDTKDRAGAWALLVEALAAGARQDRISELAAKWGCGDADAPHYASHVGCRLAREGNAWMATRRDFVDLQSSPVGFGDTALEAFSALARALGYAPAKMWGPTFASLCAVNPPGPAAPPRPLGPPPVA